MKRPTRVPASTVVRMNSASNRIAKWYQNAIIALPPNSLRRICAMPTASVGAPPVRDRMVVSPMSFAVCVEHLGRDREAPAARSPAPPRSAVVPISAAGAFIAK